MRKRYELHVIATGRAHPARSVEHALELVPEKVDPGYSWRVRVRIGAGDPIVVRTGFRASSAA